MDQETTTRSSTSTTETEAEQPPSKSTTPPPPPPVTPKVIPAPVPSTEYQRSEQTSGTPAGAPTPPYETSGTVTLIWNGFTERLVVPDYAHDRNGADVILPNGVPVSVPAGVAHQLQNSSIANFITIQTEQE